MAEVEIDGNRYLLGKIDVPTQAELLRRLAPSIGYWLPAALRWHGKANGHEPPRETTEELVDLAGRLGITQEILGDAYTPAFVMELIQIVTNTLPLTSRDDLQFVMDTALAAVRFQSSGGWAPLKPAGTRQVMLEEADNLVTQARLVFEVLKENAVLGFSRGAGRSFQSLPGMAA
ncbi:MAG: hypothetical protein C5B60_02485 [Chloroflexi bacterium]|nr:MAG: hypothetical protein C5B60_02485 [Chloroflexota bacterium]